MTVNQFNEMVNEAKRNNTTIQYRYRDSSDQNWKDYNLDFSPSSIEYRVKPPESPTPKRILPLGPEDFPPGTAIRWRNNVDGQYTMVQKVFIDHIETLDKKYSYEEMAFLAMEKSSIICGSYKTSIVWSSCYKLDATQV